MRIDYSHPSCYKLYRLSCKAEFQSDIASYREGQLKRWELLSAKGLSSREISHVVGISRATYYRHKRLLRQFGLRGLERRSKRPKRVRQSSITRETRQLILEIRRSNPTYGKLKIRQILWRDHHIKLSESSVGRVLSDWMKQGKVAKYRAARKARRKRQFTGHSQRWRHDLKRNIAGHMIQIDHMSVSKNQVNFKQFHAWDPTTKVLVTGCYSHATSQSAARFLDKVIARYPFPVCSIQVDGGSEFRRHFEQACEAKGIPLYVLPPKSPKLNGGVERSNRTLREDLYSRPSLADSIATFRVDLEKATQKYNEYRPHQALKGLTPFEYTQRYLENRQKSHML